MTALDLAADVGLLAVFLGSDKHLRRTAHRGALQSAAMVASS